MFVNIQDIFKDIKPLGFGLMRLPVDDEDDLKTINIDKFTEMIDTFMDHGFNYFDTAYIYHKGCSEKVLKKTLVDRYPRNSYKIADKMPIFDLECEEDMQRIFDEQLQKVGVDYFDYYLLHNVSTKHMKKFTEIDSFNFIKEMKKQGKIKHIGISSHDTPEFLDKILKAHPEIEFIQLQLNYLDWQDANIQAKACYDIACKYDLPVIVMEPLKGGSLVNIPQKGVELFKEYDADKSITSWAFDFNYSLDNVVMMLSGMRNLDEVNENMHTIDNFTPMNTEKYKIIDKVRDIILKTIEIPCTMCGYCLDHCPVGINIAKYFSLYNTQKLLNHKHSIAMYYRNYISQPNVKPSECIRCMKCIDYCPQNIDIPSYLIKVTNTFES